MTRTPVLKVFNVLFFFHLHTTLIVVVVFAGMEGGRRGILLITKRFSCNHREGSNSNNTQHFDYCVFKKINAGETTGEGSMATSIWDREDIIVVSGCLECTLCA